LDFVGTQKYLSTKERLAGKAVVDIATCPFGCNTEERFEDTLFISKYLSRLILYVKFDHLFS
jgi:hypothetical protein